MSFSVLIKMDLLRLRSEPPIKNDILLGDNATRTAVVVNSRKRTQKTINITTSIDLLPTDPITVTGGSNSIAVVSSLSVAVGDLVSINRVQPQSITLEVTASSNTNVIIMEGDLTGFLGEASNSVVTISGFRTTFGLPGFMLDQPQLVYYENHTTTLTLPIQTLTTSPTVMTLTFNIYSMGGIPTSALMGTHEVRAVTSTGFSYQVASPASFGASGGGSTVTAASLYRIVPGFPGASSYEFQLESIFSNVLALRLYSSEFPYTMRVINQTNNTLGWQNAKGIFTTTIPIASYSRSSLLETVLTSMNSVDPPNQWFELTDNGVEWTISCFYRLHTMITLPELTLPNHSLKSNDIVKINGESFHVIQVVDTMTVEVGLPLDFNPSDFTGIVTITYPMLLFPQPLPLWEVLGVFIPPPTEIRVPWGVTTPTTIFNVNAVRAVPPYLNITLQQVGGSYTDDILLGRIRTDGQPGDMMIDTYVSNGIDFDHPIESLNSLRILITDENDNEVDLGMGDHSFTMTIYHRDRVPMGSK